MCQPYNSNGKTCATCALSSAKAGDPDCKACVDEEHTTKKPYPLWRAKEETP